ncbi:MAG TPA: hypothetical protein VMN82_06990, partial [Thermoanaerobaculia bacterium]|nr:hypothetical protein [Thermoanaerobaculia bacterium]
MTTSRNSRRLAVLLTVLVAAVGVLVVSSASRWRTSFVRRTAPLAAPRPDVEEIGWMRLDPGLSPPASMNGLKATELPAYYRSLYRLKPDRRVLYAFEEIDRVLSGRRRAATLSVRFEQNRWSLRLDGETIGTLPEIPASSEEMALLRAWAKRRAEKYGTRWDLSPIEPLAQPAASGTAATIDALQTLNERARRHPLQAGLLEEAARRLVWLLWLEYDSLQLSDPLAGHTLALLVLAQEAAPGRLAAEEALLDFWLGFSAAAAEASRSLDDRDPVRVYVSLDRHPAELVGDASGDSAQAQFLSLLRLAEVRGEPWFVQFRRSSWARTVDPASLTLLLLCADYTSELAASEALAASLFEEVSARAGGAPVPAASPVSAEAWPYEVLREYPGNAPAMGKNPPQARTRQFEADLGRWAATVDGPLFDAASMRAFYSSAYYSAIAKSAEELIGQWGNWDGVERFARSMSDPAPGTATQLREWMLERLGLARSSRVPDNIMARLESWNALGPGITTRVAHQVHLRTATGTDPVRRALLRLVFRRLDARPSGLVDGGRAARFDLLDLNLGDRCLAALVRERPINGGDLVVRFAYWGRDQARLREIAVDPRSSAGERLLSLQLLDEIGKADFETLQGAYRDLMARYPAGVDIVDGYVDVCLKAGRPAAAHRAIAEGLARRPTMRRDLPWAHLLCRDAEVYGEEKRWRDAWRTIEPAIATGKGDVLSEAAWILEQEGAWDEAL